MSKELCTAAPHEAAIKEAAAALRLAEKVLSDPDADDKDASPVPVWEGYAAHPETHHTASLKSDLEAATGGVGGSWGSGWARRSQWNHGTLKGLIDNPPSGWKPEHVENVKAVYQKHFGDTPVSPNYPNIPHVTKRWKDGPTTQESMDKLLAEASVVLRHAERLAGSGASDFLDAVGYYDGDKDEVARIRRNGEGKNFKVLNPEDGYRKNDQLWFGKCDQCGEHVSSSRHDKGVWMHKQESPSEWGGTSYRDIDHCPKGKTAFRHAGDY